MFSSDGIIMLDGILYHAWFAKYAPEALETGEWDNKIMERGDKGHVGLPLRQNRYQNIDGYYYSASCGIYKTELTEVDYYHKKPNFFDGDKIDKLNMDKGIISDSVGTHRAYRVPCRIIVVEDGIIEFFACGRKEAIEELLTYIPSIGKKNAMGYGMVREWLVEEVNEDYSLRHPDYGLMRPMPVGEIKIDEDEGIKRLYNRCPPYHKKGSEVLCYIPALQNIKSGTETSGGIEVIDMPDDIVNLKLNYPMATSKTRSWFAIGDCAGYVESDIMAQVTDKIKQRNEYSLASTGGIAKDYMQNLLKKILEEDIL